MERIEILYFDGCPSWHAAWSALGTVLAGFAGSPTIRVDGADLFGYGGPMVMACRRYEEDGGQGWPSVDSLRERLGAADRARGEEAGREP